PPRILGMGYVRKEANAPGTVLQCAGGTATVTKQERSVASDPCSLNTGPCEPTLGNSISFFEGHARSARYPSLAEPGVDLVGLAASLVLEDRVRRAGVQQERRRCVTALYLSRHRIVPRNNFRATSTGLTPSFM